MKKMSHFNPGTLLHNQHRGSIATTSIDDRNDMNKPEKNGNLRASRSSTGVHTYDKSKSTNNSFKHPSKFDFAYN